MNSNNYTYSRYDHRHSPKDRLTKVWIPVESSGGLWMADDLHQACASSIHVHTLDAQVLSKGKRNITGLGLTTARYIHSAKHQLRAVQTLKCYILLIPPLQISFIVSKDVKAGSSLWGLDQISTVKFRKIVDRHWGTIRVYVNVWYPTVNPAIRRRNASWYCSNIECPYDRWGACISLYILCTKQTRILL